MVILVKIENGKSKSSTIIINIYIYLIVMKNVFPKSILTKMTLTTLTTFFCISFFFVCLVVNRKGNVVPLQSKEGRKFGGLTFLS